MGIISIITDLEFFFKLWIYGTIAFHYINKKLLLTIPV